MKYRLLLVAVFFSFLLYASEELMHGIVGLTQMNGEGCLCHNLTPDSGVNVQIMGPDVLLQGQTATYQLIITGTQTIGGGFNVASRRGLVTPADTSSKIIDNELTHAFVKTANSDTIRWLFNYQAPMVTGSDTIFSVGLSANMDSLPTSLDKWNFGAPKKITVTNVIPVELVSFNYHSYNNDILLSWETASETNNYGFYIETAESGKNEWITQGFVRGFGTTTLHQHYRFVLPAPVTGLKVRLKQIDFNGAFVYSAPLTIDNVFPEGVTLFTNFPNPFNPATNISFELSDKADISLKVYNVSGTELINLLSGIKEPGKTLISFSPEGLSSGIYYAHLSARRLSDNMIFEKTVKMVYIK